MVLKAQTKLPSEANPTGYYIFLFGLFEVNIYFEISSFGYLLKKTAGKR